MTLLDTATLSPVAPPLTGHEGGAWPVAFSPDGSLFASGGAEDERLIVWDATSLSPLGTFPSGPRALVAFSADGRSVATNTHDGGVAIYELDPATLHRIACDVAGRELTTDAWTRCVPSGSPTPLCDAGF